MLIVAIPKSASTALMETIARRHSLECDMHFRWDGPKAPDFPYFGIQHSWDFELTLQAARHFMDERIIFKVHVLPTKNNLELLKGQKKVVLLRSPEGIVGAYKRGHDTGVYRQKSKAFEGCQTTEDWLNRAKEIGLYGDLKRFRDLWMQVEDEKLIVHFEDLVNDPGGEIERCEDYFGLARSGARELLKRKYTRLGDQSLDLHNATVESWKNSQSGM